jgi:flagellar motor switch protein FliG
MSKFNSVLENYLTEADASDVAKQFSNLANKDPKAMAELNAAVQGKDISQAQQQQQQQQDQKNDPAHDLLTQLASDPTKNVEHINGINTADRSLVDALNKRGLTFFNPNQPTSSQAASAAQKKTPSISSSTTPESSQQGGTLQGV